MPYYELCPAYGRDYTTANEAKNAFIQSKDWKGDYQFGFRLCGLADFKIGDTVMLRYRKLTQVAVLTVSNAMLSGTAKPYPVKSKSKGKPVQSRPDLADYLLDAPTNPLSIGAVLKHKLNR